MMTRKQMVYEFLRKMKSRNGMDAMYTTEEIANAVGASRANVSGDLNRLFEEELVEKLPSWPVRYRASAAVLTPMPEPSPGNGMSDGDAVFEGFIGYNGSMAMELEKSKAAVLYPLGGLPLLIGGGTGVGKTTFARLLYNFAQKVGRITSESRFVSFNCADYANNPQLIMAQLFGYAKGAYTGAEDAHDGLVAAADGGVLFLDEVHRLPETAQEMLFLLMDSGQYHRLGEADVTRSSRPIIILATTEDKESALLATFNRRIPIAVTLPSLAQRTPLERLRLVQHLFAMEACQLGLGLKVDAMAIKALLVYDCPGNVGQLENDIKVACARAYVTCLMENQKTLHVRISHFPLYVKEGLRRLREIYSDINLIAGEYVLDMEGEAKLGAALFTEEESGNIYELLARRHGEFRDGEEDKDSLELMMLLDVESYFQRLLKHKDGQANLTMQPRISQQVLDVTRMAAEIVKCELELELNEHDRLVLARHLDTAVARGGGDANVFSEHSRVQEDYPELRETARQIVLMIQQEYNLEVPDDEVVLLASLLKQMMIDREGVEQCAILVVCSGRGSARTMARFTNDIMDKDFVKWLDITGLDTEESLRLALEKALQDLGKHSGALALTDSEAVVALCGEMKELFPQGLFAVSDISTSMVIEAALLALEHKASAQLVYHHLRSLASGYSELFDMEAKKMTAGEDKVIVTACISGYGAANKLKNVIEERFELPQGIEIVTADLQSISGLKARIAELAADREVICVIGLDVGMETNFPFISAVEFVLGNGEQRLRDILISYNVKQRSQEEGDGELGEAVVADMLRSGAFLKEYLFYLSEEKAFPYLRQCVENIEASRGEMSLGKRIMLLIHLCSMLERLIFEERNEGKAQRAAADLQEACAPLESQYNVVIGDGEYDMLEQICVYDLG